MDRPIGKVEYGIKAALPCRFELELDVLQPIRPTEHTQAALAKRIRREHVIAIKA